MSSQVVAPPLTASATTTDPSAAITSGDKKDGTAPPRLTKTTACLPIVYGSVAFFLGKKADEFQTHTWTLHLRGANHEDLSVVISKVVFQLHASFAQPIRELTSPPFEVTEGGWGEFEAQIRIIWKDPTEKPTVVSCNHHQLFYVSIVVSSWVAHSLLVACILDFMSSF
jgi:YEATS domain-containing protein 4